MGGGENGGGLRFRGGAGIGGKERGEREKVEEKGEGREWDVCESVGGYGQA